MVKKIKFPLEMSAGVQVRTLEELREHFDMEKILGYYVDGKLQTWLIDRYYEEETAQIGELDSKLPEFKVLLLKILGVEIAGEDSIDLETVEHRNTKIAKLKQFTDDDEIIRNVDAVAFDQEELSDLLDDERSLIYLCEERFTIPLSKENVSYIGIQSPTAIIKSTIPVDFVSKNISFHNIGFDEDYRKTTSLATTVREVEQRRPQGKYITTSFLDKLMSAEDRAKSEMLFNTIYVELSGITYDVDRTTKSKMEILKNAKIDEIFEKYLRNVLTNK